MGTGIGIMQGRLLPPIENRIQCFPRDNWAEEFPRAAEAGLSSIEWIYEVYGADQNPLETENGRQKILSLSEMHGVAVRSVCADYFMDRPLLRSGPAELKERIAKLRWLMEASRDQNVDRIILPFVDASRIESDEEFEQIVAILGDLLPLAETTGVELHLETSLPPNRFAALLSLIPHSLVKVNYDSGNSASLGFDVQDEFAAYGERVGSVHIKDRFLGGTTVPLGTGAADFDRLFRALSKIGFDREIILQVARDQDGDEVNWARHNCAFVSARWKESGLAK